MKFIFVYICTYLLPYFFMQINEEKIKTSFSDPNLNYADPATRSELFVSESSKCIRFLSPYIYRSATLVELVSLLIFSLYSFLFLSFVSNVPG